MSDSKKHLKIASYLVLIFTLATVIKLVVGIATMDFRNVELPDGAPENTVLITKIVVLVISALILIPQFYVGFKGLSVIKKPAKSKAHISWAIVLLVLAIIGLIDPIIGIVNQTNTGDNVGILLNLILEAFIYYDYIKFARLVAKEK